MSAVADNTCEEDDRVDLNGDPDDDDTDDVDASLAITARRPSRPQSPNASASSWSLATPSVISRPSGLPVDAIAHLTHDELLVNATFMKYVNTVDVLLNIREKVPSVRK
jgi:hypothetical protein